MKKFKLIVYSAYIAFLLGYITASGQQKIATNNKCGTDSYLISSYKKNPGNKQTVEKANQLLNKEIQQRLSLNHIERNNLKNTQAIITIPVVVHIVLPEPEAVTDSEIQSQLDVLNRDFAGLNSDSSNIFPMFPYSLRGHSNIRFCLAQKDDNGNLTNGIERRCSNTVSSISSNDPIKISAYGGLDAWDPSRYFNIWVSNANIAGVLGYATYPFSFLSYTEPDFKYQGVVIARSGFGNITSPYQSNRGRTLVHETGHYFGLFHTFEGGCENQDFNLSSFNGSSTDDTPAQINATGSGNPSINKCPSGNIATGCSSGIDSGRLYQNYMDYSEDPCMTLFTVNQVTRMEAALDLFRVSLKTSDACKAPVLLTNNISAIEILQPFGGRDGLYKGCQIETANIYCTSSVPYTVSPQVKFRNTGSNPINEVDIWYSIDDNAAIFNNKTVFHTALPSLADTIITITPISFNGGPHVLKIFTRNPNTIPDSKPDNDTVSANLYIDLPLPSPVTQGFESPVFPADGWKIFQSSKDNVTWERTVLGQQSGIAAAFMNFYNYQNNGHIDNLVSPAIDISNADSILVSFARAYRQYSLTPDNFLDTLEVVISEDCGATYKSVWQKWGTELVTNPGPTGLIEWFPLATDWLSATIDVKPFVSPGAGSLQIGFRTKNGFGQNLFLDDINIRTFIKTRRDAAIVQIKEPFDRLCSRTFTPGFVIANKGTDTLRTININYVLDGAAVNTQTWTGILLSGQTTTVSYAPITLLTGGSHTFKVYTSDPNVLPDQNTSNDSLGAPFFVFDAVFAQVSEGFEATVFPPANWYITRSNAVYNWDRTTLASKDGIASSMIRNRRYNGNGSTDDLYSPLVQINNADSVFVKFDLAYAALRYSGNTNVAMDTLEILFTKDCGHTFTSIYKKGGESLRTLQNHYIYSPNDTTGFIPGHRSEWRTDSIDLTAIAGSSGTFQLVFRNTNNNGNNIFLDNILINQVTLPARLKKEGWLVFPNPSTGLFYVRHYLRPVNLTGIQIVNTGGQLIWFQQFNGNALSNIPLDLSRYMAGIYFIRLLYTDKVITQRIIKTN